MKKIFLASLLIFSSCRDRNDEPKSNKEVEQKEITIGEKDVITQEELKLYATDDINGLDLLMGRADTIVGYYEKKPFITTINGLESKGDEYWLIYVNDTMSNVGIGDIELKKDDELKLVYGKFPG